MNPVETNKKMTIQNERTQASEVKNNSIIETRNLTKIYNNKIVLDKINLNIVKGKTTVIIGPSGCGKTVLIKHLIVLLRPSSGEVYFNHKRIDSLREKELNKIRTHFGFLFQGGALFDSLSVSDNIIFPISQHYKITDWPQVEELVKTKLAMVGLDGFQNYYPARLSGGQRKRVALARAIALNPEVILYDVINELILKLQRELSITSIVVTHDMKSAYKVGDRIIMLHNSKIIADGDADHIRNHPHPVVQQFINGEVDENDLALLRMKGSMSQAQFLPRDFE